MKRKFCNHDYRKIAEVGDITMLYCVKCGKVSEKRCKKLKTLNINRVKFAVFGGKTINLN